MPEILIIEDQAQIRANLRRLLALEGFNVVEAAHGAAGIDRLRETIPDLVLCDLMMPGVGGYEVLDFLRANPRTAPLPFVMLTASAEEEEADKCIARGADAFLTKPCDATDLLKVIRQLLSPEP